MTIDEAIQNSTEAASFLAIHHQVRLAEGVRLGVEALKREIRVRKDLYRNEYTLLPGETEK